MKCKIKLVSQSSNTEVIIIYHYYNFMTKSEKLYIKLQSLFSLNLKGNCIDFFHFLYNIFR